MANKSFLCPFLLQVLEEDEITESYVIYNKTNNGEYMEIASINDPSVTMFNITRLHPNRGYKFAIQPFGDTTNGTIADCPEELCRTKQAGTYILIATMYL